MADDKYDDSWPGSLFHFGAVRKKQEKDDAFCRAIGQQIRQVRETKGYSMRQLAAQLDMEYNQLYRIEKGIVNTSVLMVYHIAQGLEVDIRDLLPDPQTL